MMLTWHLYSFIHSKTWVELMASFRLQDDDCVRQHKTHCLKFQMIEFSAEFKFSCPRCFPYRPDESVRDRKESEGRHTHTVSIQFTQKHGGPRRRHLLNTCSIVQPVPQRP